MKGIKILLPLAAAALMMSACSSDETIEDIKTSNAIAFNVLSDNNLVTRGTVITSTNIGTAAGNFDVWALNGSDYYMGGANTGVKIKYTTTSSNTAGTYSGGGYWDYDKASDVHYWPTVGTLDFYAINPSGTVTPAISSTSNTFTYTVEDNAVSQKDIMTAVALTQSKPTNLTVTMPFHHAMSQIVFNGEVSGDMKATVKEIKLYNIKNGGTWTFQSNGESNPTCSPSGDAKTYTPLTSASATVTSTEGELIRGSEPLLLVPQAISAATISDKATAPGTEVTAPYISVTYSLSTSAGTSIKAEATEYYALPAVTWNPGYKYVYTLTFTADVIKFTCSVTDWTDANGQTVDVNN